MTHYERVRAAVDHQPVDRVPYDFSGEEVIWKQLEEHFETEDRNTIWVWIGVQ